jgi:hypothetical protein
MTENLSRTSIAFPLRMHRGLLQKVDEREAYLTLIGIMARTPPGSWAGHPSFGFRDLFSEIAKDGLSKEDYARLSETATGEINTVLAELGLLRYRVASILPDPMPGTTKETEELSSRNLVRREKDRRGVTFILLENGSARVTRLSL